jgi:hypothetical protein
MVKDGKDRCCGPAAVKWATKFSVYGATNRPKLDVLRQVR